MDRSSLRHLQTQLIEAREFLVQHQPVLELFVMLSLYIIAQGSTFQYVRSTNRAKAAGLPYKPLIVHIFITFIIVGRYYILQLFSMPTPGRFDLALHSAQVATSFILIKYSRRNETYYKAAFQTMSIMNLVSLIIILVTGSPQWHRVLVKCMDWFTYFRLITKAIMKYNLVGYPKVPIRVSQHLVSAPIALWIAGYPYSIPIYFATFLCISLLNDWVSTQVPHKSILPLPT
jgi:hypothetical protein